MGEVQLHNTLPVIAVIGGTGKQGPGLALRWACVGYPVLIGSRQAEKAQAAAAELNNLLSALGGEFTEVRGRENQAAVRSADICILTVPYGAHQTTLESLFEDLQGKILVDATARVDFRNPRPPSPPSAARIAQEILGSGVRVVAAFQNVPSHLLKEELGGVLPAEALVCADDMDAAGQVIRISEAAGIPACFAGGLDNAIVVEGLTAILISMNKHYRSKKASIHITGLDKE